MFRIHRPVSRLALGLLVCCIATPSVSGDPKVYRSVAPSSVIIADHSPLGSGVVVDVKNRYILTAEHVAAAFKGKTIRVFFPDQDKHGRVATSWDHYNRKGVSEVARIIRIDKVRDIAILQVSRLPKGINSIALAKDSPTPGETVHAIGHSDSFDCGVFSYTAGKVRNVYRQGNHGIRKIIHTAPTNPGDSGGPLVNDQGELVGLISRGTLVCRRKK